MRIGIITAMSSEQKQLANQLTDKTEHREGPFAYIEGKVKNNTHILMQCGIGKVNAAAGTVELIRNFQPDCIISTGVAGGIDSELNVMDVVVSRNIVYHDVWCGEGNAYGQIQGFPTFFQGNDTLYNCALSLDTETPIHGGRLPLPKYAIFIKCLSSASASSATRREQRNIGNNTRTFGAR